MPEGLPARGRGEGKRVYQAGATKNGFLRVQKVRRPPVGEPTASPPRQGLPMPAPTQPFTEPKKRPKSAPKPLQSSLQNRSRHPIQPASWLQKKGDSLDQSSAQVRRGQDHWKGFRLTRGKRPAGLEWARRWGCWREVGTREGVQGSLQVRPTRPLLRLHAASFGRWSRVSSSKFCGGEAASSTSTRGGLRQKPPPGVSPCLTPSASLAQPSASAPSC